jgi:hypothetical protein
MYRRFCVNDSPARCDWVFGFEENGRKLIPPEPPVAILMVPERRAGRKGAPGLRGASEPLRTSTVLAFTALPTGGAGG